MVEEKVVIEDAEGLHARPASNFAKQAMTYKCNVNLVVGDKTVNGKSVLSIMSLGIKQGTTVTVQCDGEDSEKALNELVGILKEN